MKISSTRPEAAELRQEIATLRKQLSLQQAQLAEARETLDNVRGDSPERAYLRALLTAMPWAFAAVSLPHRTIELASEAFRALFPDRAIVGGRIDDALPDLARAGLAAIFDEVAAAGQPRALEELRDGSRTYRVAAAPVRTSTGVVEGVLVTLLDVTPSAAVRATSASDTQLLRVILETAAVGHWRLDIAANSYTWDPRARSMHGFGAQTAVDTNALLASIADVDRAGLETILNDARSGRLADSVAYTYRLTDDRGGTAIDARLRMVTAPGSSSRQLVAILLDASERERARDALAFTANVAREMREPLKAILDGVRMLRASATDRTVSANALAAIERNVQRQAERSAALSDLGRLLANDLVIERTPLAIETAMRHALTRVQLTADAGTVRIDYRNEAGDASVSGDPKRLRQVFRTLLFNAIRASPPGRVVRVHVRRAADWVEIRVADDGRGYSPEEFTDAFAGPTRSRRVATPSEGESLGIELLIARRVVELHGGLLRGESEGPGRGATFTIQLPPLERSADSLLPTQRPPALEGLRVLVVEPDAEVAAFVARVLGECRASVKIVSTFAAAVESVRVAPPGVIVTAARLPDEGPLSLVKTLRADGTARIPALALIANGTVAERTGALMAGYDVQVAKPIDATEFVLALSIVVGRDSIV